jgi:ABC-type tungstate transport system permease subunit
LAVVALSARLASAGEVGADGSRRARIAEVYNTPAAQFLILRFGEPFRGVGASPPVWQTLASETDADVERLNDIMTIGQYDMIITGSSEFADKLEGRGLVRRRAPLWRERLILVGPRGRSGEMAGLGAAEIMSRASVEGGLFFSRVIDGFARSAEAELWHRADAIKTGDNRGYVETSRDDLSALFQAGDEGGFMLVGEGSFAQYTESERLEPALVKMADTDYFRETYACLMSNSGFRKHRAEDAEKFLKWLESKEASQAISGFSMGGINPFIPVESVGETAEP